MKSENILDANDDFFFILDVVLPRCGCPLYVIILVVLDIIIDVVLTDLLKDILMLTHQSPPKVLGTTCNP